jgi:hypothetical protein
MVDSTERTITDIMMKISAVAEQYRVSRPAKLVIPQTRSPPNNTQYSPCSTQPGVRCSATEPVVRSSAPEPAVRCSAPEPAVRCSATEPAVRSSAPEPSATEPAVRSSAPEPTVRCSAPEPSATEPAVRCSASKPAVRWSAPEPSATEPAMRWSAPEPSAPEPAIRWSAPEPAVHWSAPEPSATEPAVRWSAPEPYPTTSQTETISIDWMDEEEVDVEIGAAFDELDPLSEAPLSFDVNEPTPLHFIAQCIVSEMSAMWGEGLAETISVKGGGAVSPRDWLCEFLLNQCQLTRMKGTSDGIFTTERVNFFRMKTGAPILGSCAGQVISSTCACARSCRNETWSSVVGHHTLGAGFLGHGIGLAILGSTGPAIGPGTLTEQATKTLTWELTCSGGGGGGVGRDKGNKNVCPAAADCVPSTAGQRTFLGLGKVHFNRRTAVQESVRRYLRSIDRPWFSAVQS